MKDIIIIGFGGHAKSVVDSILELKEYNIIGYTDIEDRNVELTYLGTDDVLCAYFDKGITNVVIGIGYLGRCNTREIIFTKLKKIGFNILTIIDKTAIVSKTAIIGEGVYIAKGAIVNTEAKIGKLCIINTKSVIEHECQVGDYSHIAVGTVLCGNVEVGTNVFVGAGSTIIQGINIANNCTIGAGSVVISNIMENSVVAGIPARVIK